MTRLSRRCTASGCHSRSSSLRIGHSHERPLATDRVGCVSESVEQRAKKPASIAAVMRSSSFGHRCEYVFSVSAAFLCPRNVLTAFTSRSNLRRSTTTHRGGAGRAARRRAWRTPPGARLRPNASTERHCVATLDAHRTAFLASYHRVVVAGGEGHRRHASGHFVLTRCDVMAVGSIALCYLTASEP